MCRYMLESPLDVCFTVFIKINFSRFYSFILVNRTFFTSLFVHSSSSESSKTPYWLAPLNTLVVIFFTLRIAISYVVLPYVVLPVIVEDWFMILLNTLPVMIRLASDPYSSFVQINFSPCKWWISLVVFFVNMSLSLLQLQTNPINTVPSLMYCRTKWYLVSTCFVLSLLFWFSAKNISLMLSTCTHRQLYFYL